MASKGQEVSLALTQARQLDKVILAPEKFNGLVARIVGGEGKDHDEEQQPSFDLVTPQFPPDYLLAHQPWIDIEKIQDPNEKYIVTWVRRASVYVNPPTPENIRNWFGKLGELYREGRGFKPPVELFEAGRRDVQYAVTRIIAGQGLELIRRLIKNHRGGDLEAVIMRQLVPMIGTVRWYGSSLQRLVPEEVHRTVDDLRAACVGIENTARLVKTNNYGGLPEESYDRLTRLLGDPLPLKRLPQRTGG